jgi:membrane fusion protein (multidrug efflux system)
LTAPPDGARFVHRVRLRAGWLVLAGALAVVACTQGRDTPPPAAAALPKVGYVTIEPRPQRLDTTLPGRTRAFQSAEVRPQITGIVQQRLFNEGDIVRKGQALYQIDDAALRAAEASAAATLARAEATLRTLEANARRNAELVKVDAISAQANEESQAAVVQARADVAVARANLETARINLQRARIEAPIGGRISLSNVSPGALVTANQAEALTSIVQLDPMYVDFVQSTTELLQLRRDIEAGRYQRVGGDQIPVRIRLEDGTEYPHPGRLQFEGLIVNPTMSTVTLRAVVPNPDGVLLPGMYVQAQLPTGLAPDAVLVPQQSVTRDLTGRASVIVVDAEGKTEKRPIEVDRANGSYWRVDGFQRFRPGDTVEPVPVELPMPDGQQGGAQAPAATSGSNAR